MSNYHKNSGGGSVLFAVLFMLISLLLIKGCMYCVSAKAREEELRIDAMNQAWKENHKTPVPPTAIPELDPRMLSIPCVGMKESDINKTKHLKAFRKTTESYVNGNHYVYYSDANAARDVPCTVSLKCTNGVVTEVNDYRDNPKQIIHFKPKSESSSKDKYYGDAEEFYNDHIEDFEDLDEAEEYYNEYYGH